MLSLRATSTPYQRVTPLVGDGRKRLPDRVGCSHAELGFAGGRRATASLLLVRRATAHRGGVRAYLLRRTGRRNDVPVLADLPGMTDNELHGREPGRFGRRPTCREGLCGHLHVVLGVVGLLGACGSEDGDTVGNSPSDANAPAAEGDYPPELMEACEPGAREWDGVPIAAFEDPADDELVECWAGGLVPKSPPPGADDGEPPRSFDRVVFTATMDGDVRDMKQAGYRDELPVSAP